MQTSTPSRTPSPAPNVYQNPFISGLRSTHHGRALQTLRHAAEHLADSRASSVEGVDTVADREAIHTLTRLSRDVFSEYIDSARRPVTDWIVSQDAA